MYQEPIGDYWGNYDHPRNTIYLLYKSQISKHVTQRDRAIYEKARRDNVIAN